MSRFPACAVTSATVLVLFSGCMYQQPMYQPGMYGSPAYGTPGYVQPGTLVVPPSNAPLYQPGSTFDGTKPDDFRREEGDNSGRFFGDEEKVPDPREPGTGKDDLSTGLPNP